MKKIFYTLTLGFSIALLGSCGSSEQEYVDVEVPTVGLITTVKEVETDRFKIEDEQPVDSVSDSRIIAKYMDGKIDTFTLDEAKLIAAADSTGQTRHGSVFRAAGFGYFGFLMGRSMMGGVSPGAYTSPGVHNNVSNTTGARVMDSKKTVRMPSSGSKSGFGKGKSSRSYGG